MERKSLGIGSDIGDVEGRVLRLMAADSQAHFSFQGMKRALKVHQERLSRGLSRLASQGYIWKDEDGYVITSKGRRAIGSAKRESKKTPVGTSYLPRNLEIDSVLSQLKGKWFSGVRWLGSSIEGGVVTLKWVSDDGEIQVELGIAGDRLEVFLASYPPNDEARAKEFATRLFVKIVNSLYSARKNQDN